MVLTKNLDRKINTIDAIPKRRTTANMAFCVSGHEVRTEKVLHLVNFIAGMQLIVSKAHQRKALSVSGHAMKLVAIQ